MFPDFKDLAIYGVQPNSVTEHLLGVIHSLSLISKEEFELAVLCVEMCIALLKYFSHQSQMLKALILS